MLKSSWAYNNGKKMMREAKESLRSEKTGWIRSQRGLLYAERSNDKLYIKQYANKTQALNKISKLEEQGIKTHMSYSHPFVLIKTEAN